MPAYFHQPENALKRANEFLAVGKNQLALEVLYDVIKSKKHRAWQTIHEPIMLQYLKVCVDMRKSHLAKEGLYQYKNICQQNVKSFENVARAYLKLAKEKTESAREESQQTAVDTEDLNNIHTLAIVFLSATSEENAQDRADRLLLGPWVKFLWESYHQCLDLLRNNSALERLYHDVAQQAFRFCLMYARKTEFRKLCANLRMHLGQMQRHQHHQGTAVNLNNSDSQSMHLETRLAQLDGAISLELWQEAFKAVEDIHSLFLLSKKPPRAQLMASYYGKVSTLFWKCGNVLFHACTLHRLYHLSVETRKNLSQEEMQRMSTRVLLATLSIPISPERTDISRFLDMDGIAAEKRFRLASLLGLPSPPTRQSLIKDMVRFNMLQQSAPEVNGLYNWLEVDFHPLQLSDRVTKALNWVGDQAEKQADLQQYVPRLQGNTALRLLQQVAQIYQSIEFGRLASLLPFVDAFQLERYVVDAARHCDLQVRIDHMSRTLRFGSDLNYSTKGSSPVGPSLQEMPTEQIRSQLRTVSSSLTMAITIIKSVSILQDREEQHQQAIAACLKNAHWEHQRIFARRQAIEERKERLESISCQREKEELEQRDADMHKVRKAEEEHLRQEAREREKERIMQEHKQIKRKTARELLEQTKKTELGAKAFKDFDIEDFEELDQDFIMAKQVEQLEKEKNKLQERLKTQEKKIDHFERAKHLEGIPLVKKAYEEQRVKDMELWGLQQEEMISNMRVEHEKALEHKKRMSRMMEDKEHFVSKITAARSSLYEDKLKAFNEHLSEERDKRLEERKKQRKEDRRVAACRQKEEEAQRVREERLKKAREDLERIESEQREKEEREYQAHLCKLEEQECKRRTREQEIEERERRREEEKRASEERPSRPDWTEKAAESRGGWKRRVSAAETDAEWRRPGGDRQQRRQEGREDGTDETEPPRRGNGPRRGARRGAADDWAPRRAEDDDQIDCKPWKQPLRRPGGWRERERFQEDSPGGGGGGGGSGCGCSGDTNQEREERPSEPLRERRSQREEASVWKRGGETDDKGGWRDSPTERRSERRDAKRRYKHEQRSPPREQEEGGSWRRVVDADKGGERREDRDTSKEESVAGGKKRQISNNSKYYRPIYHEVAYTQTAVSYSLNHPHTSEMESTHI